MPKEYRALKINQEKFQYNLPINPLWNNVHIG